MADDKSVVPPGEYLENPNERWRNYTKRVALGACRLSRGDLKKLYRLVNEKQMEVGERAISPSRCWQTDTETTQQFQERRERVKNAFITTVQIKGTSAEVVTGHGEKLFDSALLPERLVSIEYDTTFSPKAQLSVTPNNRASVFLDFSRPPLLDFIALPSAPTANASHWFVTADTEAWSTSLSTRLQEFFAERKTGVNWLHSSGAYDTLLAVMGLPISFWGAYRMAQPIVGKVHLPSVMETGLYVYAFFVSLNVFRFMFSYARWVFPKIEMESDKSTVRKHRAVWATLMLSILGRAIWEVIRALWS